MSLRGSSFEKMYIIGKKMSLIACRGGIFNFLFWENAYYLLKSVFDIAKEDFIC
mgnify:CR=1 FL=1